MHHQVNVHKDAHQWEERQSRDPEVKSSGVLGLPPDDGRDPSDEQQQQHSHCGEHGVSREHLAGPPVQDQAQDYQQDNKHYGTSIDNLARCLGGDGAGREPQTLEIP